MIRSAALALLLTVSAFASSPEYLVGRSDPAPAAQLRFSPSTASDGDGFFVVWVDSRAIPSAIIGTRVTRAGRILDPLGLRIASATGSVSNPQVVWDGAAYLVVWTAAERDEASNVFAARVAPNGGFVMMPRPIAEHAFTDSARYLASNGSVSVVAYLEDWDRPRIVALDRDGNMVSRETLSETSENIDGLTVAAGTSRFAVAWNSNHGFSLDDETIEAVTLTATGHVIDTPRRIGQGDLPAIGTDGTRFTLVWRRNENWQQYLLLQRTLEVDLDPVSGEHTLLTSGEIQNTQVLLVGGNRYEVITVRRLSPGINEIVSIGVDRDGNPQAPRSRGQFFGEAFWLRLAAATNDTDVLIARAAEGPPPVGLQIYAQLYPGNAATSGVPALLSWSGNAHRLPGIATSASGSFVAWAEDSGVYATRIDRNGNSLDGRGTRLTTYPYGRTRVAFDGTNYVVAWSDSASVNSRFVGVRFIAPLTGATVAEAHVPIEGFGWVNLALAVSPEATYLVFADGRIRVARIPSATHIPDPVPLAVSPEDMPVDHPAVAWNGSTLLVTWTEEYVYPRADPPLVVSVAIHAARVTAGLSLLDPAPLSIAAKNEETGDSFGPPSVASNGTDWLVVSSLDFEDVIARRVLQSGTVEGNAPEKIGEGIDPAATWDGTRYAVAWKEGDYRQVARPLALHAIPPSGALQPTSRVLVSPGTAPSAPSIAPAGNGAVAVVYTKVSYLPEHAGVERSFFRVMDFTSQRGRVVRR